MSRPPFDYSRDFRAIDFRKHPEFYHIGKGEQGVLLVEPYKSEILPHWRFKTVAEAAPSRSMQPGVAVLQQVWESSQDAVPAKDL